MMIIGCDLHTRYQQIARLDMETGEEVQRRLEHENGGASFLLCAARTWAMRPISVSASVTRCTFCLRG